MTEQEKMKAGLLYDPGSDAKLAEDRCPAYNMTPHSIGIEPQNVCVESAFPLFINNDFRIGAAVAIFANQKMVLVCGQAIASAAILFADLIAQIYLFIIQQLHELSAWKSICKINKRAFELI